MSGGKVRGARENDFERHDIDQARRFGSLTSLLRMRCRSAVTGNDEQFAFKMVYLVLQTDTQEAIELFDPPSRSSAVTSTIWGRQGLVESGTDKQPSS